ncbi:MAG: DNA-3-methyladenine glycosylase [Candidatus Latescibacteria bacterium]|nr:DNA-3-methyladenine glycosylase [Candidatus Latescibacterota bacterium]
MARPYPRSFYARGTLQVARELLGSILFRRVDGLLLRGRIVETEAYVGEEDLACHARAGLTPRTEPLYGPPGRAYVYLTYGMHHLLNAVTEPRGKPAAVLIRAVEPLDGIEWMIRARGVEAPHLLASGPARLCQAFGLDLGWNRADLCGRDVWIGPGAPVSGADVATSPRIGCGNVPEPWGRIPWRFYVRLSNHVTPGRPPRKLLVTSALPIGNNRASRPGPAGRARNPSTRR